MFHMGEKFKRVGVLQNTDLFLSAVYFAAIAAAHFLQFFFLTRGEDARRN
jgi:hypothetical protein